MIEDTILEAEGKTITKIIAHDIFGYDKGFTLEFSDGLILEIDPKVFPFITDPRITIKKTNANPTQTNIPR